MKIWKICNICKLLNLVCNDYGSLNGLHLQVVKKVDNPPTSSSAYGMFLPHARQALTSFK